MNFKTFARRTAALLTALLMLASAQAESYSAIVTAKSMKIYADEAMSWNIGTLPVTTVVTVESEDDGVAKISSGDREGYASVKDMKAISELAQDAVVNRNTYAYQQPDGSSRSVKVKKGMKLNLLAVSGDWAMVENDGVVAYMNKAHLDVEGGEEDEPQQNPAAKKATINKNTYVYQKASTSSKKAKVKKGMTVTLESVDGSWAKVKNGDVTAYIKTKYLDIAEDEAEPEKEPDAKDENGNTLIETFSAKVTADRMRVYKKASTSSTCLGSVKKGNVVTVHAYNSDGWAYIELNGNTGYAKISDMERVQEETPEAEPTPVPSTKDYLNDDSLSVEKRLYMFMIDQLGFNTAAACGVLANVQHESGFRVNAASYDGGYGLVQWTGSRNTRLKNWCAENGYDYQTLEGQAWYFKYELDGSYKKIRNYLQGVENSPAGAYDAGYYFCYNFEIPADRANRSVTRGNLAKDTYWQKYA